MKRTNTNGHIYNISENDFGIICFSFPWQNKLPMRWGKNKMTPSQWPIGCQLPKWCGGGNILTRKAVQELEFFGRSSIQEKGHVITVISYYYSYVILLIL